MDIHCGEDSVASFSWWTCSQLPLQKKKREQLRLESKIEGEHTQGEGEGEGWGVSTFDAIIRCRIA